jgi:hypothetical protein
MALKKHLKFNTAASYFILDTSSFRLHPFFVVHCPFPTRKNARPRCSGAMVAVTA